MGIAEGMQLLLASLTLLSGGNGGIAGNKGPGKQLDGLGNTSSF